MCGESDTRKSYNRGYLQVVVNACPNCMAEKDKEIKNLDMEVKRLAEENKALDEEIKSLLSEKTNLKTQLWDLKQELERAIQLYKEK